MEGELLEKVYKVLDKYIWDYNNRYSRDSICKDISKVLGICVFDNTDLESEKNNTFVFMVKLNDNNSISLMEYIENYNIYQRDFKLKKILKKV